MKPVNLKGIASALCVIFILNPLPLVAAENIRPAFIPQQNPRAISNRLIVKLKPTRPSSGMSNTQIAAELRLPFSSATMNRLQSTAGVALLESHVIENGAHILILQGSPDQKSLAQVMNNIRSLSEVEYVEEDRMLTRQLVPNDVEYNKLWGAHPVIPAATSPAPGASGNYGADFQTAWDTGAGSGVVIAVVDTGITPHTDIVGAGGTISPASGNLVSPGYDFISDCRIRNSCLATTPDASTFRAPSANATDLGDSISTDDSMTAGSFFFGKPVSNSSWHGTHVSGIAAAIGNNTIGVIGGAYLAKILPVRVLGKGGGRISDITQGILWAAGVHSIANPDRAKVINISLGGEGACSITEQNAIDVAVAAGAVVVVAAGNENADIANSSPANCQNVISVAAIGRDGSRATYSNFSSPSSNIINPLQVTLAAQGGDQSLVNFDLGIFSTLNSGLTAPNLTTGSVFAYYQGTSMATPQVAAVVALMLSRNPALTPAQVKTILSASTTPFPSFSSISFRPYDCATLKNCGAGVLNARLAVSNSLSPMTASTNELDFGTLIADGTTSRTVTLTSIAVATLTTATITGINSTSFSITNNTCVGSISVGSSCQVTLSFTPKSANTNVAGLFIATQATLNGGIAVALSGVAKLPQTVVTALAATKNSSASRSASGGGCSITTLGGNPDLSLLFALLALLAYRYRPHRIFSFAKN